MPPMAPFFVSKSQVVHFFVVTWLPNLIISDTFKEISGPDPDEKLAPNIIDKYKHLPLKSMIGLSPLNYQRG